jgi:hypothetical protein
LLRNVTFGYISTLLWSENLIKQINIKQGTIWKDILSHKTINCNKNEKKVKEKG